MAEKEKVILHTPIAVRCLPANRHNLPQTAITMRKPASIICKAAIMTPQPVDSSTPMSTPARIPATLFPAICSRVATITRFYLKIIMENRD